MLSDNAGQFYAPFLALVIEPVTQRCKVGQESKWIMDLDTSLPKYGGTAESDPIRSWLPYHSGHRTLSAQEAEFLRRAAGFV